MWFKKLASKRRADLVIVKEGNIYLERWWLIPRNRWFNVYLHKISGPDDRTPHCHPWISLSYCLAGVLREYRPGKSIRLIFTGDMTYRRSTCLHSLANVSSEVWTIFFTGPEIREWGFMTETGWEPQYLFKSKMKEVCR